MSDRNVLRPSPVDGANDLIINGFTITMEVYDDIIVYSVYRKNTLVYSPDSLQDAVKWCED